MRGVEQPALLEVGTRAAAGRSVRRQIAGSAWRMVLWWSQGWPPRKSLHEPNAPLDEPPGDQAPCAVFARGVIVKSIEPADACGLAGDVECFLGRGLHGRRQLVAVDSRFQVGLAWMLAEMTAIEPVEERKVLTLQWAAQAEAAGRG